MLMADTCNKCQGELSNFKEIIKCSVSECGKYYHIQCRNISIENFRKMGSKKLTWKCAMCDLSPSLPNAIETDSNACPCNGAVRVRVGSGRVEVFIFAAGAGKLRVQK
jgi:hypothetical protein